MAAWRFLVLPLVDGILPEIQPLLQLHLSVCLPRLTDRSSKPCKTHAGHAGSMSYCSQIIYSKAAQIITIATSHSHPLTICLYSLTGPTRQVVA